MEDDFEQYQTLCELLPKIRRAQAVFDVIDSYFSRDTRPHELCDDLRCAFEQILEHLTQEIDR
jgi:hypothetical protein